MKFQASWPIMIFDFLCFVDRQGGKEAEKMREKPYVVKTHDVKMGTEYSTWIQELKKRYQTAQIKAAVKVNSEQLLFNLAAWSGSCYASC